MKRSLLLFSTLFLFFLCLPAAAQKFQPKAIQFRGAPEYTDQELMVVADLKNGMALTSAEMNDHSKRLLDSGLFEKLAFNFDGQNLIFSLVPSSSLYPVHLVNLPFSAVTDPDAALRKRLPLFHGKVPIEGALLDSVRIALQEMLATQGIHATITATPFTDLRLQKVTAMSFAITEPPVQIGEIRLESAVGSIDPKTDPTVQRIVASLTGSPYSVEDTPNLIATSLGNYFRDKGYLETEIRAESEGYPVIASEAVRIPFHDSVSSGPVYTLAGVQLAPGVIVSQTDFARQAQIHHGDIAAGPQLREEWMYIERQYHNKGYMKARVHPTPSFDRTHRIVSYTVEVEPGPVYNMGTFTIRNVSDDLRAAILAAWKMPAGAPFDEGAVRGFFATHGINPALERVFATVNLDYVLKLNDDARSVDLVLRLEKKH